ncbi:MAG: potassium channel family protein [Steroidobacteraceae bacterium]
MRAPISRKIAAPGRAWRALDQSSDSGRRLYFGRPTSARRALLFRAFIALGLVVLVTLVFLTHREGLRDNLDGHVSISDTIYFSLITLTTVGYGDIVPVSDAARLTDAFLVTPVRLLLWAIFVGTAYQFVVQRIIEDVRMRMRQAELHGHTVICGFGLSGRSAAHEITQRGTDPSQIVAIDIAEDAVQEAAHRGFVGLRGDATRESVLESARVREAATAMIAMGRDDTSALVILTLRALAPGLRIVALVRESENEPLLHHAGASATICPSTLSGVLMANSVETSRVAEYIHDMLTIDGRVLLAPRVATERDVGCRPTELEDGIAVRIQRAGRIIGFWEQDTRIENGDQLLVLTPRQRVASKATS